MIEIIKEYLYNRDENSVYFILLLFIFLLGFLELKYIVCVGIVIYIFMNMNPIKEKIIEVEKTDPDHFYYNDTIHDISEELRKYRKYNMQSYTMGTKYLRKFFNLLSRLEKVEMEHMRQSFENAEYYMKEAVNSFQMLTISVKERSYGEQLEQPEELLSVSIGKLCKELHKECYYLLWNLSKKINETNKEKGHLDRYKTYFHYNTSMSESYDKLKESTQLF